MDVQTSFNEVVDGDVVEYGERLSLRLGRNHVEKAPCIVIVNAQ